MTNTIRVMKRLKSTGEHLATYGIREAVNRIWTEDAEQGICEFYDKIDVLVRLTDHPYLEVGHYFYTMYEEREDT